MPTFQIDHDIRRAHTLPSEFYTEERFFKISKERIFARTWQLIGRAEDVDSLFPVTILPGFLDEPVLIVRDGEKLKCLSNVCTHRGNILVETPCRANLIRCGYHGRRFSLDGKFLSMPEFETVENFPSGNDDLPQIPFAERAGFLFASVDPVDKFNAFVNDAAVHLEDIDPAALIYTGSREYEIDAHWALYCENYLEGLHIPFVHRSLNEVVDYGTYTTETFRYSSLQTGFDTCGKVAGRYLFIFPNTMFNFYPWGISVNIVRPITARKSIVSFLTYVLDESKLETGAGANLHDIEMEDEAVVESVQNGICSRFYKGGRYSPTREQGTHHFHRLIAEFIG